MAPRIQGSFEMWGYDQNTGDFREYATIDEWKNEITCKGAKRYLKEHLKKSLIDDFLPAYCSYIKSGSGFFALPRIIFPVIDFLGALYKGSNSSRNAYLFMRDYLGQVKREYTLYGDLIYYIYRHGLVHTQMPKIIKVKNTNIGWTITFDDVLHLNISPVGLKPFNVYLSPHQLFLDLCKAINIYISDFDDPTKRNDLLDKFKEGFIEMARVYDPNAHIRFRRFCQMGLQNLRQRI